MEVYARSLWGSLVFCHPRMPLHGQMWEHCEAHTGHIIYVNSSQPPLTPQHALILKGEQKSHSTLLNMFFPVHWGFWVFMIASTVLPRHIGCRALHQKYAFKNGKGICEGRKCLRRAAVVFACLRERSWSETQLTETCYSLAKKKK